MTIHGLPSPIHDPRASRAEDRATTVRDQSAAGVNAGATASRPAPAGDVSPMRATGRVTGTLPAEAPPGTDPALWSVLTTEERAFFSKMSAQGPLTYTKLMTKDASAVPAALPRGSRMDVRV